MNNTGRGTPLSEHSGNSANHSTPQGAAAAASEQYEFNPETDILDAGRANTSYPPATTTYVPNMQPNGQRLPAYNQHFFNSSMFNQPTQPAYYHQQPTQFNHFNQHLPHNNFTQQPMQPTSRQRGYGYAPGMAQ